MTKLTVSVPGKLMIMGEYAVLYGQPCLSTAVDLRLSLSLQKTSGEFLDISTDTGLKNYRRKMAFLGRNPISKEARFIESAVNLFREKFPFRGGLKITTHSQLTPFYGLGSSAAVTVAAIFALNHLFGKNLSNKEIFNLSLKSHYSIQKKGSGFDIASALYGGTIYYQNRGELIEKLDAGCLDLIIIPSGLKAETVKAIEKIIKLNKNQQVEKIFENIGRLVKRAKKALQDGDSQLITSLINDNQLLLDKLGVVDTRTQKLISNIRKNGASAVKISGAGGGDCLIALGNRDILLSNRVKIIKAKINAPGAKLI